MANGNINGDQLNNEIDRFIKDTGRANTFVNGDEQTSYLTDAGIEVPSIRNFLAGLADGIKGYATLAELNNVQGAFVGQLAKVTNDGKNSGTYRWDGSAWIMSDEETLEDLANGQNVSFVPAVRDGVISPEPNEFLRFVKACTVEGIPRGKIAKIEYFQNKSPGFDPPADAFIFSIFNAKDFSGRDQLNSRVEAIVELDRTLKKQIVQFEFKGIVLTLMLDPSALPPEGTALFANQPSTPGYSWYIGEVGYTYKAAPEFELSPFFDFYDTQSVLTVDRNHREIVQGTSSLETISYSPFLSFDDGRLYEELDRVGNSLNPENDTPKPPSVFGTTGEIFVDLKYDTKELGVAWPHSPDTMCKVIWKPNGYNSVFNFYQFLYAPMGDPDKAPWTIHQSATTDYIPPITNLATTGDITDSGYTTMGGNHPGPNGEFTGFLQACDFYLNGKWLLAADYKGYSDAVGVRWRNGILSGNTVFQQRITISQEFAAMFRARGVELVSKVTALEPIDVFREGGTQMVFSGWEDGGYHFWGGKQHGPVKYLQRSGSLMAATRAADTVSGTATVGNTVNVLRNGVQLGSATVASTGAYSVVFPEGTKMFDGDIVVVNEMNGATQVATVTLEYILTSGNKLDAPTAWANVVKNNTLGFFAAWIDRGYGVKMDWVKDDNPPSSRNLSKCYNFSVKWDNLGGTTDPNKHMNAGDSYTWRGGYSYSPVDIVTGLDGAFVFWQNGKLRLAVANKTESLNGTIKLPHEFISADFEEIGPVDSIGTPLTFTQYSAKFYKEAN